MQKVKKSFAKNTYFSQILVILVVSIYDMYERCIDRQTDRQIDRQRGYNIGSRK